MFINQYPVKALQVKQMQEKGNAGLKDNLGAKQDKSSGLNSLSGITQLAANNKINFLESKELTDKKAEKVISMFFDPKVSENFQNTVNALQVNGTRKEVPLPPKDFMQMIKMMMDSEVAKSVIQKLDKKTDQMLKNDTEKERAGQIKILLNDFKKKQGFEGSSKAITFKGNEESDEEFLKRYKKENSAARLAVKTAGGTAGAALGTLIGGALGTAAGPFGTVGGAKIGGFIGSILGGWIGSETAEHEFFEPTDDDKRYEQIMLDRYGVPDIDLGTIALSNSV